MHTRAQNFYHFQGSCGACKADAVISRGSTHFNSQDFLHARATYVISQDFLHARVQNASNSKVLCMQGLKMQLFRESLCMQELRNSKCFNFHDLAIFKVLCLQGSIYSYFLGFCAWKGQDASIAGSKCFNCQGFRCPNIPNFCVLHWSTCRLYRFGSKNGHSGQILIQT